MAEPALVELIYEAIAEEAAYADLTRCLAQHIGGSTAWIQEIRPEGVRIGTAYEFNPDIIAPYEAHFHAKDLWLQVGAFAPHNTAVRLERYVSAQEYANSEIYNDLVRRNGDIFHSLGAVVESGPFSMGVGVQRKRAHDPFDEDSERALQELIPHLQRMMRTRRRLEPLRERLGSLESLLDLSLDAVLFVSADMAAAYMNAEARRLVAAGRVQAQPGARIALPRPADNDRLRSAVLAATRGNGACSTVFPIEDDALQAAVDPLLVQLGSARLALVRLRDRESTVRRQAARGAAQYGFTRAETAVAEALLRGMTAAEIAALESVSEQTVRSQIRALLEKSGSSRQAELIVKLGASLG